MITTGDDLDQNIEINQSMHEWDQRLIVPQETTHPLERQFRRLWRLYTDNSAAGLSLGGAVYGQTKDALERSGELDGAWNR